MCVGGVRKGGSAREGRGARGRTASPAGPARDAENAPGPRGGTARIRVDQCRITAVTRRCPRQGRGLPGFDPDRLGSWPRSLVGVRGRAEFCRNLVGRGRGTARGGAERRPCGAVRGAPPGVGQAAEEAAASRGATGDFGDSDTRTRRTQGAAERRPQVFHRPPGSGREAAFGPRSGRDATDKRPIIGAALRGGGPDRTLRARWRARGRGRGRGRGRER